MLLKIFLSLIVPLVHAQSCTYAPSKFTCSQSPLINIDESSIADTEQLWLAQRDNITQSAWIQWLSTQCQNPLISNSNWCQPTVDPLSYPRIAVVASGGGTRSILNAAGVISTFETNGDYTGLFDATSYLTGVSGGAWLVGSFYGVGGQNPPRMQDLVTSWNLQQGLLQPDSSEISSAFTYNNFNDQVDTKNRACFKSSLVDFYGRVLSSHLTNAQNRGECYKWSDLAQSPSRGPLPIIAGAQISKSQNVEINRDFIWEFSPYSSGHSSGASSQFVKTSRLGSSGNQCVNNFDNFGFLLGLSSAAFLPGLQTSVPSGLLTLLPTNDLVAYIPDAIRQNQNNQFVDGGFLVNMPIWPVENTARNVSIIIAIDSSADTSNNYPNGTGLIRSKEYANRFNVSFPSIPATAEDFISNGYNQRIVFFGCFNTTVPLIVFIPNQQVSASSNIPSTQIEVSQKQQTDIFYNGRAQVDTSHDLNACIACAWAQRVLQTTPSAGCQQCITDYCYSL